MALANWLDVQFVAVAEPAPALPDWIPRTTFAEAVDICEQASRWDTNTRVLIFGALYDVLHHLTPGVEWPAEAGARVGAEVEAAVNAAACKARLSMDDQGRQKAARVIVETVCRLLLPVDQSASRYAPVAVLLGPNLRRLSLRHGPLTVTLRADWPNGLFTEHNLLTYEAQPNDTDLARDLRMPEKNSHVARVVMPAGHPLAGLVRAACAKVGVLEGRVTVGDSQHGTCTLSARRFECACHHSATENLYPRGAMNRSWRVWAPIDFVLRPCDVGPCPNCDKWHAPGVVQHEDGRTWDAYALRVGETVAWHELSDRSILEIAAFLSYLLTQGGLIAPVYAPIGRSDLSFALTEAAYRNMIPTADELRVAAYLAEARGVLTADDIARWTLVELWARCMPILWGGPSPCQ